MPNPAPAPAQNPAPTPTPAPAAGAVYEPTSAVPAATTAPAVIATSAKPGIFAAHLTGETHGTPAPADESPAHILLEEIQATAAEPRRNRFWLWSLLSLLLALLFTLQYAYFNLASLSQQPQLRPALFTLCGLLKCEVPLIRAPYMITLLERDIRNDPSRPGVLLVKARIINKAPHPQAYPQMALSLHNITGHTIASRTFTPDDYLTPAVNQKEGMAPQQVVDIQLELADPGKEAVGFEFEFM